MMFKGEIILNFWLSALIYNPLEAFILIYFCKNIIKHCYLLGFINLLFQYSTVVYIQNESLSLIYDLVLALVISPFILLIYLKIFSIILLKLQICFYACIFNFISLYMVIILIDTIKNNTIIFNEIRSLEYEIFINLTIKIFQLLLFLIFRLGEMFMKKILKQIAFKNTEKAFTIMQHYQPKMPKILKEKLEKNK